MKGRLFFKTDLGKIILGECRGILEQSDSESVDLIVTSSPFALVRKTAYRSPDGDWYNEWFKSFGMGFRRVLKDSGSLVVDAWGAWRRGSPTKSLYNFKKLVTLCEDCGFHWGIKAVVVV